MNRVFLIVSLIFALVFAPSGFGASAAQAKSASTSLRAVFLECRENFYNNVPPSFTLERRKSLSAQAQGLCFDGFAVLHSGVSRTPLWAAEHLTRERVTLAASLVREDSFRVESRLPHADRAELRDYSRSGYDRGHLAPNGDMASTSQQYDSFSLANIAPQNATHNRNLWRHIEGSTRQLARKYGDVYVVTGVAFLGENVQQIGGRVLVPTHFYKAVYIPSERAAGVYFSPNTENARYEVISLDELAERTGIKAMPSVPAGVRARTHELLKPADDGVQDGERASPADLPVALEEVGDLTKASSWLLFLLEIFKYLVGLLNE
ncbi:DNA/RNA non-specific endonuclease [Moraxella caviae]|nr:DNA/RNA non-specific endonuclease [Moraxella caviae]